MLLKECHDGPLAGHGGAKHTITFLKKSYYWPNLKDDAKEYVKTCLTCQQNQTFNNKQAGLLRPLSIPKGPWESVSWTNGTFLHKPKSKLGSHIGARINFSPKRGSKQGELTGRAHAQSASQRVG
jgi:hypothetical protein